MARSEKNNNIYLDGEIAPGSSTCARILCSENANRILVQEYEKREYQVYLLRQAIARNVIICLPTGSGKTFIAAHAAKHFLVDAAEKGQKIIFVAPTVPLAHQQAKYFEKHLGTKVSTITGELKPQDWEGVKWKKILADAIVYSMTAQVLADAILHTFIGWKDIAVLLLDECHNAVGNHAMCTLMESYRKASKDTSFKTTLPRIIGLTATIVIGDPKSAAEVTQSIQLAESKFCAKAMTYHDYEQVVKCSTSATIELVQHDEMSTWPDNLQLLNDDMTAIIEKIQLNIEGMREFLFQNPSKLRNINHPTLRHKCQEFNGKKHFIDGIVRHVGDIHKVLIEMGPYCAVYAALMKSALACYTESKEKLVRKNPNKPTPREIVCRHVKMQMDFVIRKLRNYMSAFLLDEKEIVLQFVTPKVRKLVKILEQYGLNHVQSNICGIVFCQNRIVCQMLSYYLESLSTLRPEEFGFLKCSFVLGSNGGQQNEIVLKAALRKQTEVLNNFREKKINLLVATNVLEEGLNVPSCNFICRFDEVATFPSFIQSMGRARMKGAKFYVLIPSEKAAKITRKLSKFKNLTTTLSDTLIKKFTLTEKFYNAGAENDFGELELNKLIPPFQPKPNGAQITAGNATQIVYQYCNGLSCDKLSTLSPIAWSVKEVDEIDTDGIPMYKVYVQLPPGSCVKLTEGGWFVDRNIAKKAAFLETCKKLYFAGALYEKTLLPIPPHELLNMNDFIEELEGSGEKFRKGKKIGGKNATEWYPRKIPSVFLQISATTSFKVYAVTFTKLAYFGHEENEGLYNFEDHRLQFAIVTQADLAMVPDFLLYSRDGNFRVSLKEISVTNSHLELPILRQHILSQFEIFQDLIFTKDPVLLGLDHPVLATIESPYCYVAPLRKTSANDYEFAYDIIQNLQKAQDTDYTEMKSTPERDMATFTPSQLKNALVVPCISRQNAQLQSYCVVSLRNDLSPLSTCEMRKNGVLEITDFVGYYKHNYGVDIIHQHGPMIRGKPISAQLHYLKSPYYEDAEMKSAAKANISSTLSLIPELMRVHPVPASLYIQLKMMPSCMHRIERLLLANEILSSVAPSFPVKQSDGELKRILEDELQRLNQEVVKLTTKPDAATPKNSASTSTACEVQQSIPSPLKRKLWVEIEYIHPKNIKLEDLVDPLASDSEDDMDEMETIFQHETQNYGLIPMCLVPCQNFDLDTIPGQPLVTSIMEAITLANARDYMSYEKLEMIGDSVLKLIVTLHIYFHFPDDGEGRLTALRTKLISNRHLYITAAEKNHLGDYLAGSLFEPKYSWIPPGKNISSHVAKVVVDNDTNYAPFEQLENKKGDQLPSITVSSISPCELGVLIQDRIKQSEFHAVRSVPKLATYTHSKLGDKSLADSVEALIGAYYMSGGIKGALKFMDRVGLRGPTNDKPARQVPYQEMKNLPNVKSNYPLGKQSVILDSMIDDLESRLGYKFKNRWLVVEALTHPSAVVSYGSSYQRLEFLGDAILDFLVTHFIYQNKKMQTPGKLTDLRSALVNNVTFGSQSVRHQFHLPMRHFSQSLRTAIDTFVECQKKNGHKVTETFELLSDNDCTIAEDIEVPKSLGDLMESLAGAVFIDSGRSLDTVWKVFYRIMKPEIDLFSEKTPLQPLRQLYERFPNKVKINTISDTEGRKVVELSIAGHGSYFGCGSTKKSAKEAAAKYAVKTL